MAAVDAVGAQPPRELKSLDGADLADVAPNTVRVRQRDPVPTVAELPRTERRVAPPAPEPELSLDGELDLSGAAKGKVRGCGGTRGTPAIVALHRIVISWASWSRSWPAPWRSWRSSFARLTRTRGAWTRPVHRAHRAHPDAQYIERTCTRDDS